MIFDWRFRWAVGIPKIQIAHGSETSRRFIRALTVFLVRGLHLERACRLYYE